jgi:hypothetical protein
MPEKARRIRLYSRPTTLAKIDERTREAALMRKVRDDLTRHVGGRPSVTQRLLIERAAVLALRVAQIDEKIVCGEMLTGHDNDHGLAWINALRRTLQALGLEPAAVAKPDPLRDHFADIARQANRPHRAA